MDSPLLLLPVKVTLADAINPEALFFFNCHKVRERINLELILSITEHFHQIHFIYVALKSRQLDLLDLSVLL